MRPNDEWLVEELLALVDDAEPPVAVEQIAGKLGFEVRIRDDLQTDALLIRDTGEILVKRARSDGRMRFSVAHELGHFVKGHNVAYARARGGREPASERREADRFAAQLVIPTRLLLTEIAVVGSDPVVLAERFDVSVEAMRIRLSEIG